MRKYLVAISIFLLFSQCADSTEDLDDSLAYVYEATVLGEGTDCGETFVITIESLIANPPLEEGIYYAFKLEDEYKVKDLKLLINARQPTNDEAVACSTMGIPYAHLIVENASTVD